MKYCEKFAALLDPYVDGELTGEEAARVREHLESCPGCQSYVDGALAIRAAFPEAEETVVPEGFAQGVMDAVRAEEKRRQETERTRKSRRRRQILLSAAACFALVLVLRTLPGGGDKTAASPTGADNAAPAAMDTAAADGSGEYGYDGVSPQMETADDIPAEAPAAPEPRIAAEGPAEAPAAPSAPEGRTVGRNTSGAEGELPAWEGRAIRLTGAQAEELLADWPYTAGEDGVRCYQLPTADFDALLETLAERGIVPPAVAPEAEDTAEGYDLVYVTEE